MSLNSELSTFKINIKKRFKDFFSRYNQGNNPYFVDFKDSSGKLKSEAELMALSDMITNKFAEDVANDIYNFVKKAQVKAAQNILVDSGTHKGFTEEWTVE